MNVAPRAGAWIETYYYHGRNDHGLQVAPRAGAWIETAEGHAIEHRCRRSLPVRERGLKRTSAC